MMSVTLMMARDRSRFRLVDAFEVEEAGLV